MLGWEAGVAVLLLVAGVWIAETMPPMLFRTHMLLKRCGTCCTNHELRCYLPLPLRPAPLRVQVNIPLKTAEGLPVGLGLLGPPGSDEDLLELTDQVAELLSSC